MIKMPTRSNSFRSKIMNYNLMLIAVIAIVCTTYVVINNKTIDNYNGTYVSYNELNHFYGNMQNMNDSFQVYLYSPSDENYQTYRDYQIKVYKNLDKVEGSLREKDMLWRLKLLRNMVDGYCVQADKVEASNLQQEKAFNEKYQELLYDFDLIKNTASEYYGITTDDMQLKKESVNLNQRTMQLVTLFFILYVAVWMIYFSITTIKSLTDPIDKLINNMNRIKMGGYDLTQISNTNKEMNVLCLALEDMADSIQQNIRYENEKAKLERRVLEQQNENLKKDELLAQSELRILQNQINPHFLFNTLNMIYKKAYSEGALDTSELIERTSQLLRYGLDNANKVSCLKNEIKAIQNYTYIQKMRYGERIQFLLEVEENVPDVRMPTMILQPLVENAVSHGLKDTIEDGEVMIEVSVQDQDVVISVSDNGCGMPAEQLEKLILNDFRVSSDDRVHLGLYNVTKRLKAFYGDDVKIIVNSLEDCGFEIIIRIALEETSYV